MGLLDQLGSAVGGALGQAGGQMGGQAGGQGGINGVLIQQLISMLSKPGALQNIMGAFNNAGLGHILQSWIGTGQNLPISADQVTQVLGSGTIADLAKHAGIGAPETAGALSNLLPQVVDKISPGGSLVGHGEIGNLLGGLGKLLG